MATDVAVRFCRTLCVCTEYVSTYYGLRSFKCAFDSWIRATVLWFGLALQFVVYTKTSGVIRRLKRFSFAVFASKPGGGVAVVARNLQPQRSGVAGRDQGLRRVAAVDDGRG